MPRPLPVTAVSHLPRVSSPRGPRLEIAPPSPSLSPRPGPPLPLTRNRQRAPHRALLIPGLAAPGGARLLSQLPAKSPLPQLIPRPPHSLRGSQGTTRLPLGLGTQAPPIPRPRRSRPATPAPRTARPPPLKRSLEAPLTADHRTSHGSLRLPSPPPRNPHRRPTTNRKPRGFRLQHLRAAMLRYGTQPSQ